MPDDDALMVLGFDLNDPEEAGYAYSLLTAVVLVLLTIVALITGRYMARKRRERDRQVRLAAVTSSLWMGTPLLEIPEVS